MEKQIDNPSWIEHDNLDEIYHNKLTHARVIETKHDSNQKRPKGLTNISPLKKMTVRLGQLYKSR